MEKDFVLIFMSCKDSIKERFLKKTNLVLNQFEQVNHNHKDWGKYS